MTPEFSCGLVRASAQRLAPFIAHAEAEECSAWKGYRVRMIDGTQPDGSEHRLEVLRKIRAAGLPCRLVALFDPSSGMCVDVRADEDAYTSEQVLAEALFQQAQPNDLLVGDRHFCVARLMACLTDRKAYFVVREHLPQLILDELGETCRVGRVETGTVWKQAVQVTDGKTGRCWKLKRIILKLDQPTEKGDTEIYLLTNLPARTSAANIARLYRQRWSIERYFDFIKNQLHGQIESLGQPRASIFAMCMSMVASNALAALNHILATTHGKDEVEKLSGYYLADEIAGNYRAVTALVPQAELDQLSEQSVSEFWTWCQTLARSIRLTAFYAHPRGPKKPPPKKASGRRRHHYSTQRLLDERKKEC